MFRLFGLCSLLLCSPITIYFSFKRLGLVLANLVLAQLLFPFSSCFFHLLVTSKSNLNFYLNCFTPKTRLSTPLFLTSRRKIVGRLWFYSGSTGTKDFSLSLTPLSQSPLFSLFSPSKSSLFIIQLGKKFFVLEFWISPIGFHTGQGEATSQSELGRGIAAAELRPARNGCGSSRAHRGADCSRGASF